MGEDLQPIRPRAAVLGEPDRGGHQQVLEEIIQADYMAPAQDCAHGQDDDRFHGGEMPGP
eukprot:942497-Pyramimonas_sp.AAC.1